MRTVRFILEFFYVYICLTAEKYVSSLWRHLQIRRQQQQPQNSHTNLVTVTGYEALACRLTQSETLDLIWGSNWKCFPLMSKKSPHMHYYNCLCLLHMVLYWFPDIEKIRWKSITFASSNQVMIHLYGISWFKMLLWEICCHNRKFSI